MAQNLLKTVSYPNDLRALSKDQLPQLAQELRDFIIDIVAVKEGHLGASLGVVELTIALHYCFNTPEDKLIWDVGHQAYGHKILTGRKDVFHTNRTLNGISGFPKIEESIYDCFGTGHSSTAISASLGMAIAARLVNNNTRQHIAVVGDASIASGMALEALNHAGVTDANLLVILNDNAIGIDPSVGALKQYFSKVTLEGRPDTDTIFEALNFDYTGAVDGHNIEELIAVFETLKQKKGPKILHVITKKGKGLKQAEEDQITYHAPGKFNPATGDRLPNNTAGLPPKFQDVFGHTLVELAKKNDSIIGITPAMATGSSLKYMMEAFPDRAFDVGIAEQHAVTLSAGLATEGLHVFCNIYSTFLQRAYDQVIHDVCIQKLPVIFCLDRAGMVGEDGATHHGIFDFAFLRCIPNISIAAPSNAVALRNILYTAQLGLDFPIAIRYPRGRGRILDWKQPFKKIAIGQAEALKKGTTIALLCIGSMVENAKDALDLLPSQTQKNQVGIYDMCFVKPLDVKLLSKIFEHYTTLITIEDGVVSGGFGSAVLEYKATTNYTNKVKLLGVKDEFPQHARVNQLQDVEGISPEKIKQTILTYCT